jgi:hypothetical protein
MEKNELKEEELRKYKNYLLQSAKWIKHEGKNIKIPIMLQMFVDAEGKPFLVREA